MTWALGGAARRRSRSRSCSRVSAARAGRPRSRGDDAARRGVDRASGSPSSCSCATSPSTGGSRFTVLLAVFADDTVAYIAGRLFGRHKLAPAIVAREDAGRASSPGPSPASSSRSSPCTDRAPSCRSPSRSLLGASSRSPPRSATCSSRAQARHGGQGHGPAAARPRRRARPARRPPLRRGRELLRDSRLRPSVEVPARLAWVKRIRPPRAPPVRSAGRRSRSSTHIREPRARRSRLRHAARLELRPRAPSRLARTQVGGDLVELLERAEPDVVLNAVVGFAGLPATLWTLERGRRPRAREQGEPRRSRRARAGRAGAGRRPAAAGRQRALRRSSSASRTRSPDSSRLPGADRVGRPLPGRTARS